MHRLPNSIKNASTRRPTLALRAPAKVNLALAVGPPRASDGFHPICSWMSTVALADDLDVTRLEDDRLSRFAIVWADDAPRPSPVDWSITKDLAVRAHALLEKETGRALPVQMKLSKRIPVGGGLGGGSSDAAAMLVATRALFSLPIGDGRLRELAMTLGSDVAFFLAERTDPNAAGPLSAIVEGFGERLSPIAARAAHLVLLIPDFGCPTGAVYRAFDALTPAPLRDREVRALADAERLDSASLFNDLAPAAEHVAPALGPLREHAARAAAKPVHITGSGSTMFIVCESEAESESVRNRLNADLAGCVAVNTRLG